MTEIEALQLVANNGYMLRFENNEAWFVAADRPTREPVVEIWPDPDEIPSEIAWALIDAGFVKERLQYSLDGGTLVWVYTLAEQAKHASAAN